MDIRFITIVFNAHCTGSGAVSDIPDPGGERRGGGPQERDQQSDDQDGGGPIQGQQGQLFHTAVKQRSCYYELISRYLPGFYRHVTYRKIRELKSIRNIQGVPKENSFETLFRFVR